MSGECPVSDVGWMWVADEEGRKEGRKARCVEEGMNVQSKGRGNCPWYW